MLVDLNEDEILVVRLALREFRKEPLEHIKNDKRRLALCDVQNG